MRIAFVTFEYPPHVFGGAGTYAAHLARSIAARGHEIVVFTPGAPGRRQGTGGPEIRDVPVSRLVPFPALGFWLAVPAAIRDAGRKRPFDIVHINGLSYGFLQTRLAPVPHVLTIHHPVADARASHGPGVPERIRAVSGEDGYVMPIVERRAVKAADRIIAVSGYTRDRIVALYGLNGSAIDVVHNGISDEPAFAPGEPEAIRARLGIPPGPAILFVGRTDDPRKGLDILIRAFAYVPPSAGATLVVTGRGDVTRARAGARIPGRIIFTGFVDDRTLAALFRACPIHASPSRLEGFGLTIPEALRAGASVIATRAGAIPELFGSCQSVRLVEPGDEQGLARAIAGALEESVPDAVKRANRDWVAANFSWDACAQRTTACYERCREGRLP